MNHPKLSPYSVLRSNTITFRMVATQKAKNTLAAKVKEKVVGVDVLVLKIYLTAVKRKSSTATGTLSKS